MMNKCQCGKEKPRRYLLCKNCWGKLSAEAKASVYRGEKGRQSLRAVGFGKPS